MKSFEKTCLLKKTKSFQTCLKISQENPINPEEFKISDKNQVKESLSLTLADLSDKMQPR